MTMRFASGATSISLDVQIVDDSGLPVTGLVAAGFPAVKYSAGAGSDSTLSLSDLAALGSAHSSGGVKERGEGVYRLDLPNLSDGTYTIRGEASGKRLICPRVQIGNIAAAANTIAANALTVDGLSLAGVLKLLAAALCGKLAGVGTGTITIRAADDSKTRITTSVDGAGNRTAVTLDDS